MVLSTAIPIEIAAIVIVIISKGTDIYPIIPKIKLEAKIFGIMAMILNFIDLNNIINIKNIKIITPNIAKIIAIDVKMPNKIVGMKLEKLRTEKPNAIVIEVVKTAKPADEFVNFIESISSLFLLYSLKRYK